MKTKKLAVWILVLVMLLPACNVQKPKYEKYSKSFFDTFDTQVDFAAYTQTEEDFHKYYDSIYQDFIRMNQLFDIYHNYEGINNIKTINDQAGLQPVKVDADIINLLVFAKESYRNISPLTNVGMGSVLAIWHTFREAGMANPEEASIPPMDQLEAASLHTNLDNLIINQEESTVFLNDPEMRLDVGAVAKGYAAEMAMDHAVAAGLESGILSAGGNIKTVGKPLDGVRDHWGIGLQNPDVFRDSKAESILDVVFANDVSLVTSGDYQRFYVVDGQEYHHIIDPATLMPATYFKSVTIMTEDSTLADFLSTTVYLMDYASGRQLVESMEGVEAFWVMKDGSIQATEEMAAKLKSNGAQANELRAR